MEKKEWVVGDWGFGEGCQYKPWAEKMSCIHEGGTGRYWVLPAQYSALKIDGV